jgi:hypothetical protein
VVVVQVREHAQALGDELVHVEGLGLGGELFRVESRVGQSYFFFIFFLVKRSFERGDRRQRPRA